MSRSHQPRKRFGQNFLRDAQVIDTIIQAVAPGTKDIVVEIGPGQGALTQSLARGCQQLHLVELDRDLVATLQRDYADHASVTVHASDVLQFSFTELAAQYGAPLRVLGNLPYNISTPLLFHLFKQLAVIDDMHFMLQREVVQRITAQPGNKDYGRLSVISQYYCDTESLFDVHPEAFFPAPKVMSSILHLRPHASPRWPANNTDTLQRVVKAAFAQRRKTLRNTLKGVVTSDHLEALSIDPGCRAESLSVEQFVAISNSVE